MTRTPIATPAADTPGRREYSDRMGGLDLAPLWLSLANLVTPEPVSARRPAGWAWSALRPAHRHSQAALRFVLEGRDAHTEFREHRGDAWGRDHTDTDRLAAGGELAREGTSRNPRWGTKPARFIADHLLIEHRHVGQIRRNAESIGPPEGEA